MLGLIGVSVKTASIELREKFSFSTNEIIPFINQIRLNEQIKGAVIVSTCNRTEIYFEYASDVSGKVFEFITQTLLEYKKVEHLPEGVLYNKLEHEAIDHLFRVVSGIDSQIIGEDQILGQVKDAFKLCLDNDVISPVLTRMFNKSFEAGKRVRFETGISKGCASVSSVAVDLCQAIIPDFVNAKVLLIGTGQAGELALINILKKGNKSLLITNRTYQKAVEMSEKYKGFAFDIAQLDKFLFQCDVVMVATSSSECVITKDIVEEALKRRDTGQLYIDLSVPRNISSEIAEVPGVKLYVVDDLKQKIDETTSRRKEEIFRAIEIMNMVKQEFMEWLGVVELTPTILKIKENFHEVNNIELEGFIKINCVKDSEILSNYANHICEKYARLFIRNLKQVTGNGQRREYIDLAGDLFNLAS